MYLKQIELVGFKSFTDRTKIQLEQGISCIVGPNGSGKSNISDAIRWVLGEQNSRLLRGSKQEDVIFSGSKRRKALGMAEVSLTLDNSDGHLSQPFTEIVITRRAFRDGAGEFLINNRSCRLKDITNLFLDSGIGLEGISLIGQDKVNEIVTAKPEGRRAIVEEASGIIKYRNRKRESIKKLTETEHDLERIGDIIGELAGRLEPLREQAESARRFLVLEKEKDELELAWFILVLADLHSRLAEMEDNLAAAQSELMAAETRQVKDESSLEQLKAQISGLDLELESLRGHFYELQGQAEKIRSKIAVSAARKDELSTALEQLHKKLAELFTKEEELCAEKKTLQLKEEELQADICGQQQFLAGSLNDEESKKQALAALEAELERNKETAFKNAQILAELRNKLHYQEQLMSNNKANADRLRQQQKEAVDAAKVFSESSEAVEKRVVANKQQAEMLLKKIRRQEDEQNALSSKISELAAEEVAVRYETQSLKSRIVTLEEMSRSGAAIFPGVRGILAAKSEGKDEVKGVVDSISRLIDVDEKYQAAIESYLGANLQNIVTLTEADAKSAVAYLKKNERGRATFLPLGSLQVREKGDFAAALGLKGVIGCACDLIDCDNKVRPAVDFLLNRVLITEDLESATAAARALKYRYSIVALSGDMVNPGASITGGSRNFKEAGLLNWKTQIKKAQAKLNEQDAALSKICVKLSELRQLAQEQETDIADSRGQLSQLSNLLLELDQEKQQIFVGLEHNKKQIKQLDDDISQLEGQNEDLDQQAEDLREQLAAEEKTGLQLTGSIEALNIQLVEARSLVVARQEDLMQYRLELTRKQQQLSEITNLLIRSDKDLNEISWEKENVATDIAVKEKQLADFAAVLVSENDELLTQEQQVMECEAELNQKSHGLKVEFDRQSLLEKTIKAGQLVLEQKKAAFYELEIKKTRVEADFDNEQAKLKERFALNYKEAVRVANESTEELKGLSRREISLRLGKTRRELAELGPVNQGAIKEYDEVRERYGFLTTQRSDLLEAKAALDKVISEMDSIMISRFRASFRRLSEEFAKSFSRLFGGGSAELIMTDPHNLLETGIDLVVNLPGKHIANYNLLSGGEKSLCGIALLFAVLAVRPTPFCVMDEVDAALDEVNVDRFGNYLQELSARTQFLMISHRQGTMEKAESLWGVTMEEEGVSKLISVKLT
ncbi:MAG: chromosome segregation protein SMC [Clostridia bacterium]|nr:chromosome segregation protein SMC [Clostridia bacterium]